MPLTTTSLKKPPPSKYNKKHLSQRGAFFIKEIDYSADSIRPRSTNSFTLS